MSFLQTMRPKKGADSAISATLTASKSNQHPE